MRKLECAVRRWLAVAVAAVALSPSFARANEQSGFVIAIGKFTLRACYTDTMDYADGADLAIRDPRRALS